MSTQMLQGVLQGLRLAVISPDPAARSELESALCGLRSVTVAPQLERYPSAIELSHFLQAHAPSILFIDIADVDEAIRVATDVEANFRGRQVVGFGREHSADVLLTVMRAGMREFLPMPLNPSDVLSALERLSDILRRNPLEEDFAQHVFSFVPAKAGAGASTVACNLSFALSLRPDYRVVLIDFDLNGGLLDFMMKLPKQHDVRQAALFGNDLDESIWNRMVAKIGTLHCLAAGDLSAGAGIHVFHAQHLLSFLRRQYSVVCLDHSGGLEEHSVELLVQSTQIFVVCTPELICLHAARRKLRFLRDLGLSDRVRVVLNRSHPNSTLKPSQIEESLGVAVFAAIPNGYAAVQSALAQGSSVSPRTPLGHRFQEIAQRLLGPQESLVRPNSTLLSRLKSFGSAKLALNTDEPVATTRGLRRTTASSGGNLLESNHPLRVP